jgi:hypothetical protein
MDRITTAHAVRNRISSVSIFRRHAIEPLTLITLVDFSDRQATSPRYHLPEPQENSDLGESTALGLLDAQKRSGAELQEKEE